FLAHVQERGEYETVEEADRVARVVLALLRALRPGSGGTGPGQAAAGSVCAQQRKDDTGHTVRFFHGLVLAAFLNMGQERFPAPRHHVTSSGRGEGSQGGAEGGVPEGFGSPPPSLTG
ncbi:hypothetical protein AB0D46_29690, partial [Streptomyces sp. NPDC048383]